MELAGESSKEEMDIEIKFTESDLSILEKFFAEFNVYGIDAACYVVQEHWAGEGISNISITKYEEIEENHAVE